MSNNAHSAPPIYRLTCQGESGKSVLFYSPHESKFWDESGSPALPVRQGFAPKSFMYNEVEGMGSHKAMSPENPAKKSRKVNVLKIQMGLNCNYSCAYCSQASHLQHGEAVITNVDDAKDFLARLDTWLESVPMRIEFWGGEPFVYWKAMQVLVDGFKAKFPSADFNIVTNGSLLDDEKFDWIVANDLAVALSHDGPGQAVRGPDPLDDPDMRRVWQKMVDERGTIGKFSFNTVLTANNCDSFVIRQWFVDRFGPQVVTNYEGVAMVHDDASRQHGDVLFSEEQYRTMQGSIYHSIISGHAASNPTIRSKVQDLLRSFELQRSSQRLGQKCGMDREGALAVDLKGNALTCHNTGANSKHNIGSVYDFDNISLDTSWHWSQREACNYCPVLQTCQGGCMYLADDDFVDSCDNEYAYNMPILLAAIAIAFNVQVIHVEGEVRRPKKTAPARRVIPIQSVAN